MKLEQLLSNCMTFDVWSALFLMFFSLWNWVILEIQSFFYLHLSKQGEQSYGSLITLATLPEAYACLSTIAI